MWFGESHAMIMCSVMRDLPLPVAVKMISLKKGTNSFGDLL